MPPARKPKAARSSDFFTIFSLRNPLTRDFFRPDDERTSSTRSVDCAASSPGSTCRISALASMTAWMLPSSPTDSIRATSPPMSLRARRLLRSTAVAYQRSDEHWLGVDLAYRQDLRTGLPLFGSLAAPAGVSAATPALFLSTQYAAARPCHHRVSPSGCSLAACPAECRPSSRDSRHSVLGSTTRVKTVATSPSGRIPFRPMASSTRATSRQEPDQSVARVCDVVRAWLLCASDTLRCPAPGRVSR